MKTKYRTILLPSEGEYKEKGSKFLAFAYPVTSEEEVKERLEYLKKTHHKARHHCYAYVLGERKELYRANDAGEPANSAGKPILGQIHSKDLTNVLVVVVRYFGGVKLGVGGLIQAYKTAAEAALNQSEIIEKDIKAIIRLVCDFKDLSLINSLMAKYGAIIAGEEYHKNCKFVIEIPLEKLSHFEKQISQHPDIQYQVVADN